MTQIEVMDQDIAEALRLGRQQTLTLETWPEGTSQFEAPHIIAHARTIAKLRVAREALRKGREAIIHYSGYPNECIAAEIMQALAHITQETPNA